MKQVHFKKSLINYCQEKHLDYVEISDTSISLIHSAVLKEARELTALCDEWYIDHKNDRLILIYNTGRVYYISKKEITALKELIQDLPFPVILAKYGLKDITTDQVTFVSKEDAFAMKFMLLENTLLHDEAVEI